MTTEQLVKTGARAHERTTPEPTGEVGARPRPDVREWMRRHPSLVVFLLCFVAVAGILLFKNRHLFHDQIHEDGDFAANSILMQDAEHLDLVVGNYSRQNFHHPGPAAFYIQAGGEVVFHDVLGVAPTPYDGQAISILLLYSALVGLALMIVYDVSRQPVAVLAGLAAVIAFCSAHELVLSSTWMPYYYFAPCFLFLVGAASVGAGNSRHLWCMALAGGLLVHGHVEFVFFVPVIALAAVVAMRYIAKVRFSDARRHWVAFGVTVGVFLFPMLIDVVFHYPGEFAKYWEYSQSNQAGGHSLREAINYVLGFWSRDPDGGYALPLVIVGVAALLAVSHPVARTRRLLVCSLAAVALLTALFVFYAVRGIDDLTQQYIGFFYWAAPMTVMVVAAIGAVGLISERRRATQVTALVTILVLLISVRGTGLINTYRGSPNMVDAVHTLAAARANGGQSLVINLDSEAWPDAVGVIVEADREGVRACIQDRAWELIVTNRFICASNDVSQGQHLFFGAKSPANGQVIVGLPFSLITLGDGPGPG